MFGKKMQCDQHLVRFAVRVMLATPCSCLIFDPGNALVFDYQRAVVTHSAGAELRKIHFAEEWNELHHLQVSAS